MATFSTEPGRKTAYSVDIRWRVVWQRLAKELSFREIARNLNISLGTAHNIWERFVQTGEVDANKQPLREDLRKLDEYHELLIVGLILEKPHLYLREIRQYLFNATGVEVSDASVCRIIRKHGMTKQKMRQVALQRCSELRARFMAEICWFSTDKFV